jgi:lrgB family protein
MEMLNNSVFFSVLITLIAFEIGTWIRNKTKLVIASPLLLATAIVIVALLALKIDYDTYSKGAAYISYLLTPATVCLAVPLYEKLELLKKNMLAVVLSVSIGIALGLLSIFGLSLLFKLEYEHYATLLPKSITTAIGLDLSKELGGIPNITAAVIAITGIFGNLSAGFVMKIFRITDPIAQGLGIGTGAHAMGTVKAIEMGKTQGAMSSLALVVAGIVTVLLAPVFSRFF